MLVTASAGWGSPHRTSGVCWVGARLSGGREVRNEGCDPRRPAPEVASSRSSDVGYPDPIRPMVLRHAGGHPPHGAQAVGNGRLGAVVCGFVVAAPGQAVG